VPAVDNLTCVHVNQILMAHIVNEMDIPHPVCIQIDHEVAAIILPHDEGYENGDSNESLVMEVAINKLMIVFSNFLHIANRCQHRHRQQGDSSIQAMNIVCDLQFK